VAGGEQVKYSHLLLVSMLHLCARRRPFYNKQKSLYNIVFSFSVLGWYGP